MRKVGILLAVPYIGSTFHHIARHLAVEGSQLLVALLLHGLFDNSVELFFSHSHEVHTVVFRILGVPSHNGVVVELGVVLLVTVLRRGSGREDERRSIFLAVGCDDYRTSLGQREAHAVVGTRAAGFLSADYQSLQHVLHEVGVLTFFGGLHLPDVLHVVGREGFGNLVSVGRVRVEERGVTLVCTIEVAAIYVVDEVVAFAKRNHRLLQLFVGGLQLGAKLIDFSV